jgi:hypothetical protein
MDKKDGTTDFYAFFCFYSGIYLSLLRFIKKNKEDFIMRRIIFMLTFILSVWSIQAADITAVSNAIKAGNADLLNDKMSEEVDISVPGTAKKGSGNDAVTILKTFFGTNKVSGFTVAHHADKNESGFFVAKLTTDKGEYRVNVTYTTKDGKIQIQAIRIE